MYNMINIINTAVHYIGKMLRERVNSNSTHHKQKKFFFLFL